ncbi:monovalent cation/H(+) antiporter subunit G [Egibacter rhizosphaerae]|uniref:Monovalent cation/H(+) antiporter subunit G n=1 Tax=Egibacter rhizosphaerae TaxID=1670831 RepID=A0A411YE66_9ACTN|nr:monovalent cation/H(+) antiporter subunit G [Egibacter rhizosphaerae]QBI19509.1 monovalent cation/H(+) antiporter subunit G [Egibacter rhizosphaerae]
MSIVGSALIGLGVVLVLLAGVGVLRFPDLLTRVNASTKAVGLGVALVLAGVAFLEPGVSATVKMVVAIFLQFATAPLAGHVLGRAAYHSGTPLWEGTVHDDLAPHSPHRDRS